VHKPPQRSAKPGMQVEGFAQDESSMILHSRASEPECASAYHAEAE